MPNLILVATLVTGLVHLMNSEMYLRKNKSIVDDRELEKIVKGKFSVKEKVGF